jgi:hypothetical protein
MYFLRLAKLKPAVEELAQEAWEDFEVCLHFSRMDGPEVTGVS